MKDKKRKASEEDCPWGFERPQFTREMKETHTILCPDIFPIHMRLVTEIFKMYGYRVEILRSRGRQVIQRGLEQVHNDMCYPAICMCGQQIDALTSGKYDPHKVALIQFQTGGGCRASNYIWMLRKALHNMGFDYVPVLSLSFSKVEKHSGFRITPMMMVKGLIAILYGDMMMLLKNQVKPYEQNPGDTDAVMDKWYAKLADEMKHNRGLFGRALSKNLRAMAEDFHNIPRTAVKKTKVGIVGEIYVKYSAFGNNGLEDFLAGEGCEYMVPGVFPFFQYMFDCHLAERDLYGDGSRRGTLLSRIGAWVGAKLEKRFQKALEPYPEFVRPGTFRELRERGEKLLGRGVNMGEGWLLPAEIAELVEKGYTNVICVQPFGCLPNHIVGKGVVRTIRNTYPHANICPVDYDAGASKVNQENRIKLMLALTEEEDG